ncbi:MAG: excisionase family DNA-binding protein [Oscillospiraceae bacterium]|nr:excisionase family DNA-binding protein [Oscillospiraceae bacterium]
MKERVRLNDKPTLTIEEAAELYSIGQHKLRALTDDSNCNFVLFVGRKKLIKKRQFDEYIAKAYSI